MAQKSIRTEEREVNLKNQRKDTIYGCSLGNLFLFFKLKAKYFFRTYHLPPDPGKRHQAAILFATKV